MASRPPEHVPPTAQERNRFVVINVIRLSGAALILIEAVPAALGRRRYSHANALRVVRGRGRVRCRGEGAAGFGR